MSENKEKKESIWTKQILKIDRITLSVTIAISLITMFIIFIGCVYNTTRKARADQYGPFHAEVVIKEKEMYKKIRNNILVKDVGYISVKHYGLCNDKYITYDRSATDGVGVGSLNKDVLKLYKVEITKGRLPKNNKEIILSEYFDIGEGTIKVGDSIELSNVEEVDTYKVVGFYEDSLRVTQYNEDENLIERVNALTYDEKAKIQDDSVVYVRFFDIINLEPYSILKKMGVRGSMNTNTDLVDILDVRGIFLDGKYGLEYLVAELIIIVLLLIIGFVIVSHRFVKEVKTNIKEEDIKGNSEVDKEKNTKTFINSFITKKVLKGVGIAYIVAIVINIIVSLVFGELILATILWQTKLQFSLSIPAIIISLIFNAIIISLAYVYLIYKIKGMHVLSKEKGVKRNKIVSLIIIGLVFIVTLSVAITLDKKFNQPLKEEIGWIEFNNLNSDIRIKKDAEIYTEEENNPQGNKANRKKLCELYKKVKEDISKMSIDKMETFCINKEKITFVDNLNPDLKKLYKEAYIDHLDISNRLVINEIYLSDEDYKALIEDNKLDKDKYIGVENPPAIVMNVRRLYVDSVDYVEGTVLRESQKELEVDDETIKIGDLINEYDIRIEFDYSTFENIDSLYLYYPESSMKGLDNFIIDIYAKDYDKLESEFKPWLEANKEMEYSASTPTADIRDLKEEYNSKKIMVWGTFAIINLVTILFRLIISKKLNK